MLLISDPGAFLASIAMPLVLGAFLLPVTRDQLVLAGRTDAGGEQVVPGMAVLFGFIGVQFVGMLFYREHAWGTWDRLRASPASTLEIVAGKAAPLYLSQVLQVTVVLLAGVLLFDYRPNGSPFAIAALVVVFVAMLVAFGVMLVALCASMDVALMLGSLGGMVMAGLGGALAPVSSLPGWTRPVARATPAYWAIDGLRAASLDAARLFDIAGDLGMLLGFTVLFSLVAALRLRMDDVKIGTT